MQSKSINSERTQSHDRLAKVGEILARGIWRMKQREAQEREQGIEANTTTNYQAPKQ